MVIYKTTNKINGKIYVGQTKKMNDGYLGSGKLLLEAIRIYGRENFSREVLCVCSTFEELDEMEKQFIKKLNSTDPNVGYNILSGGQNKEHRHYGSFEGRKHTKETKKKMSKNNGRYWLGKTFSNDHIEKIRKSSIGRKHTEGTKKKIRDKASGRKYSSEVRQKVSKSKMKPVEIDGIFFESCRSAAEHYGVNPNTISRWIKKDGISVVNSPVKNI